MSTKSWSGYGMPWEETIAHDVSNDTRLRHFWLTQQVLAELQQWNGALCCGGVCLPRMPRAHHPVQWKGFARNDVLSKNGKKLTRRASQDTSSPLLEPPAMETRPQSYDMYYVTAFQKGAITANPRGAGTAEIRLFYRCLPWFWVSGYCTKRRIQNSFHSSSSRSLNLKI